jgi:hypothetical protein
MAGQTLVERYLEFSDDPTPVVIGPGSLRNGTALKRGLYYVIADVDCFIKQGDNAVTATASSIPLFAKVALTVRVKHTNTPDDSDAHIAVIHPSNVGTSYIIRAKAG